MQWRILFPIMHCRVAQSFGVCERTFLMNTEKVIELIIQKKDHFIKLPLQCENDQIAEEFNRSTDYFFPGVVGAVDG